MDSFSAHEPDIADLLAARPALAMDAQAGLLFEGVPLNAIADSIGTPSWVYGAGSVRGQISRLKTALDAAPVKAHIHYAVKANDHLAILALMRGQNLGADVVSQGEMRRALRAGIAARDIVFSGVGKSAEEISAALGAGIGQINAESAEELAMIAAIAQGQNATAHVVLRMNPDIDAGTHAKITTGVAGNKFGIPAADIPALYAHAARLPGLHVAGLALHIGSQILSPAPYRAAYEIAAGMIAGLRAQGQIVETLDLGGGLGIGYGDDPGLSVAAYAHMIAQTVGALDVALMIEPGRFLIGPAGLLLASVNLVKHAGGKRFIVLDAAMNDLLRPALYDSYHGILPLSAVDMRGQASLADIVGPVCESSDMFAADRLMPELALQSRVAILDAGAYGAVMSSTYNARPLAAAVLIDAGQYKVIRPRQRIEALWADEQIPDFST